MTIHIIIQVPQEDLPTFLKVAERLQVKWLNTKLFIF